MKKQIFKIAGIIAFAITTYFTAAQAAPFGLEPQVRIGISGMAAEYGVDGEETLKNEYTRTKTSRDAFVVMPAGFIEAQFGLVTIGFDVVQGSIEFENTGVLSGNDDSNKNGYCSCNDNGTQKAAVEISNHTMLYVQLALPMNENMYVKVGAMNMDVKTTESLVTGSSYGNTSTNGIQVGVGIVGDLNSLPGPGENLPEGFFYKAEIAHSVYDDIALDGSKDEGGQFNRIVAENIEGTGLRLSLGKAF